MPVDDKIHELTAESDIAFRSDVYNEIHRELTDLGLNLAFFVFETPGRSSFVRRLDGKTVRCPVLTLYLKYDTDFDQTGIDPHHGNWDDKWTQTGPVRGALNAILRRSEYADEYLSEHTFVFVRTLENLAFCEIGREYKDAVERFVREEAPGVEVQQVFWNGLQYDVIMRDKADYKRVKRTVKTKLGAAIPKILAAADTQRYCQSYKATVEFGYAGMNLFHLIREDL